MRNDFNDDKTFDRMFLVVLCVWVFGFLLSAALTVAIIWAIVKIVLHFT